ncbi:NusG domain II-containing protein [Elusimicrobiota bacterium]
MLFVFAALVVFFLNTAIGLKRNQQMVLRKSGKIIYKTGLPEYRIIEVNSNSGGWILQLDGYRMKILGSTCPKQICVSYGWTSDLMGQVVCLPNRLSADIIRKRRQVDAITR